MTGQQEVAAGIGPFDAIPLTGRISPASLVDLLDPQIANAVATVACLLLAGCRTSADTA